MLLIRVCGSKPLASDELRQRAVEKALEYAELKGSTVMAPSQISADDGTKTMEPYLYIYTTKPDEVEKMLDAIFMRHLKENVVVTGAVNISFTVEDFMAGTWRQRLMAA